MGYAARPPEALCEVERCLKEAYAGKRCLVTGGFGFLGGHLARRLIAYGAEVMVLDIDTTPERPSQLNLGKNPIRNRANIACADVRDAAAVHDVLRSDFNHVFHLAAYSIIEMAAADPLGAIGTNTMGIVNILEAIRNRAKLYEPPIVVLASTDKVYGETSESSYVEETPLNGVGIYDAAKLAADVMARTYGEVYKLPTVVLRFCNLFGPYDFNTSYRLIPRALAAFYSGRQPEPPVLYYDSLEHTRDYLYVGDAVRALLLLGSSEACRGGVFNAPSCFHASTPEVLKLLIEVAASEERHYDRTRAAQILTNGIRVEVRQEPTVIAIKRQQMNAVKIEEATGFKPSVGKLEALVRTVRFYRAYYSRCKRIRRAERSLSSRRHISPKSTKQQ